MSARAVKWLDVVGARPQFIKLAPILRAIENHNQTSPLVSITEILVHTGQHYDHNMSRLFFEELSLKEPDHHLEAGSGTQAYQTGEILKRAEDILALVKPDLAVVYGDTNSTLGGALAAAKLGIPVAHVEAGLRSFNRKMPEEINRVLADHLSELLFCPTPASVQNLRNEGIVRGVHLVGDVMLDAALLAGSLSDNRAGILQKLGLTPKSYSLATVHRAENTDDPERLAAVFQGLEKIATETSPVVLPLHPRTKSRIEGMPIRNKALHLIEPVSYLEMLALLKGARVVLTDSGGLQKEACILRVPCVTLREETEWVETVQAGWNVLAGAAPERIAQACKEVAESPKVDPPFYGDGKASDKIVRHIVDRFN